MKLLTIFVILVKTITCNFDKRVITTLKYSKYQVTPTIVNGRPAVQGQVPFLVSYKEPIQRLEPEGYVWSNLCGGSIIDLQRVLTAAHCFEANDFYYAKHPGALRIVAGDINTDIIHSGDTETTAESQWRRITRIIIHAHFSFPNNDIAITIIDVPWVFSSKVNLIKIAKTTKDYTNNARQCVSAGYGKTGHQVLDTVSPILLTAYITTMARGQCSLLWEMNMNTFICTDTVLTDVARGDSGGPLICQKTGDPNEVNDEGVLVGVVSGKNYDKTSLYTRVSAYHDWIERNCGDKVTVFIYFGIILLVLLSFVLLTL